jgi:hypothetical protein
VKPFRGLLGAGILCLLSAIALLPAGVANAAGGCSMGPGGRIRHVIVIQFDNVHLARDNPRVPSDIEQIPALYNFMTHEGTLLSNDHTVLISHTSDGILSTETGLYPDQFGGGVGNTYPYLDPKQTETRAGGGYTNVPGTNDSSLFKYWTDPTSTDDPLYMLIHRAASGSDPEGINTPAPWATFTRAGCDFAGIGAADMELENDTTDVSQVFGPTSTQSALGNWSYNTAYDQNFGAGSNLGTTDFEGLAIHCSRADSEPGHRCSAANGGEPDSLPDEPGGYSGFNGLFGAVAVDPALTGKPDTALPSGYTPSGDTPPPSGDWAAPPVYDVFAPNANNTGPNAAPDPGNVDAETTPPPGTYKAGTTPTTTILDETGNPGFPGFDGMEANNALGYTAAAQESGIPVTYTYLSDVHDDQYFQNNGQAFGPGEAGHEAQLHEYNTAFTAFFRRLASDDINKTNTLFLFTVDEGDHYAGGPPLNPDCNGDPVPCQYDTAEAGGAAYGTANYRRNVGEVDVNLPTLVNQTFNTSIKFGFDNDDAPAIIVPNQSNPAGERPGPNAPVVRALERDLSATKEYDPIDGVTRNITVNLADETEESVLHMLNADPSRMPTMTLFGHPDFYFQGLCTDLGGAQGTTPEPVTNHGPGCPAEDGGFAWNHGDVQPEIASTWQGWVGPGIRNLGETGDIWTDHTDARPTMMTLLGLRDDYTWDGRAIEQILSGGPVTSPEQIQLLERLGATLKQLDAPFGRFGLATLEADTKALATDSPADSDYTGMVAQLKTCQARRSDLLPAIQSALQQAESGQTALTAAETQGLVSRARGLIDDAQILAHSSSAPAHPVCT